MVLLGERVEGLFYLFGGGLFVNTEDAVVVLFGVEVVEEAEG